MAKEKFEYGDLKVVVDQVGEGSAPWDERQEPRHEYAIMVTGPGGAKYVTRGWGSTHDWETGELSHRSMAWSAIDDLLSAASDPDEFITLVIGERKGRDALDRGKVAEKVIRAAKKFPYESLQKAVELTREEGA